MIRQSETQQQHRRSCINISLQIARLHYGVRVNRVVEETGNCYEFAKAGLTKEDIEWDDSKDEITLRSELTSKIELS